MAKKKLKIDKSLCIGCASCAATDPDNIEIGPDGLAQTKAGEGDDSVVDVCPVQAISVEE